MAASRLAQAASEFAEGARAENTRRAYASDWADFSAWCRDAGVPELPAEPTTVANYLYLDGHVATLAWDDAVRDLFPDHVVLTVDSSYPY